MYKVKRFSSINTKQKAALGLVGVSSVAGGLLGAKKELKNTSKNYESNQKKKINRINKDINELLRLKKSGEIDEYDMNYLDTELESYDRKLKKEKETLKYIKENPKKYKARKVLEKSVLGTAAGFVAGGTSLAAADKISKGKLSKYIMR